MHFHEMKMQLQILFTEFHINSIDTNVFFAMYVITKYVQKSSQKLQYFACLTPTKFYVCFFHFRSFPSGKRKDENFTTIYVRIHGCKVNV
jgi:hypothetical protein